MAEFFVWTSFAMWVLGFVFLNGAIRLERKRGEKGKVQPFTWLFIGTALAIGLLYYCANQDAKSGWFENLLLAILGTIRVLTGENSVADTRAGVVGLTGSMVKFFSLYTACLHFTASSVVLGFLLKIVDHFFPMLRYHVTGKGRMYIFSGVSEREILLAEDIRRLEKEKNGKRSVIVFLEEKEDQAVDSAMRDRIQALVGFLFYKDIATLKIPRRCQKHRIDYFLLKAQDGQNINDALELAEKYKVGGTGVYVHVLSDYPETESLLDSVSDKCNCNFRLIPETRTMLYQLLSDSPLFMGEKDGKLCILIVGAGRNGQEAVKVCSWCGCMGEELPEIWIIDREDTGFEQLLKDCPETMREHVHYEKVDVCTPKFHDFLRAHRDIGYVICALGEEHLNLRIAMEIRSVSYEEPPYDNEAKALPVINVRLDDAVLHRMAKSFKFDKKTECRIHPFGNLKEFYTWENVGDSYLEGGGLAVHGFYKKLFGCRLSEQEIYEDYESTEYNRSSSMATALHGKYKAYACLGNQSKYMKSVYDWSKHPDEEMCRDLAVYLYDIRIPVRERLERAERLARMEHARWNAYTRSLGWKTADAEQAKIWKEQLGTHKNVAAKLHPLLVAWEELDSATQGYDRNLSWNLPFILYEALRYDDLNLGEKIKKSIAKTDMGNYTKTDFEAILYWMDEPAEPGEKIIISGKRDEVASYFRQALLMNIWDRDNAATVKYEICSADDLETEFANIVEQVCEQVEFKRDANSDTLEIIRTKCDKTEIRREQINSNKPRLEEMKYELVRKARAYNEYYRIKYNGSTWEELDDMKKGSNICAAAVIANFRKCFVEGMDIETIAAMEHERWCRFYYNNGWKYGEKRDDSKKIHNCLLPYNQLSEGDKEKDRRNIELGLRIL